MSVLINGRYRPVAKLGEGGMGWTMSAEDMFLRQHTVALKFLYPHLLENESSLRRFRNEVLHARKLVHPNIVRTYNFSTDLALGHNIVMEFVDGRTLRQLLDECRLQVIDLSRAARLLHQIVCSVQYAHSMRLIHLDLKPENVLLDGAENCRLADFGLAQPLRRDPNTSGVLIGTPRYMAPEQFRGTYVDKATDIYSLGILGYELFVGQTPFQGETLYNLAHEHLEGDFPDPKAKRRDIPEALSRSLQWCCAKDQSKRLPDLSYLRAALEELIPEHQSISVLPSSARTNSISSPRLLWLLLLWKNRQVRRLITICSLFIFIFYARMEGLLHEELAYYTLYLESKIESSLFIPRYLFRIKERADRPLVDSVGNYSELAARLRLGADPNERSADGRLPLVAAAGASFVVKGVSLLLKFGANPSLQDIKGQSPIHSLKSEKSLVIARELIRYGANPNLRNTLGLTPMFEVVRRKDYALLRYLLAAGADPNIPDADGQTLLQVTRQLGDLRAEQILLTWGAKLPGDDRMGPAQRQAIPDQHELRAKEKN